MKWPIFFHYRCKCTISIYPPQGFAKGKLLSFYETLHLKSHCILALIPSIQKGKQMKQKNLLTPRFIAKTNGERHLLRNFINIKPSRQIIPLPLSQSDKKLYCFSFD